VLRLEQVRQLEQVRVRVLVQVQVQPRVPL
jgi:hypothetical protein